MGTPLSKYAGSGYSEGHSIFVAALPQLDEQPLFSAVNFDVSIYAYANHTVHVAAFKTLWCPSDPLISARARLEDSFMDIPAGKHVVTYSSYGGCAGTWYNHPMGYTDDRMRRIPTFRVVANGAFYLRSAVRFSQFGDGQSTTLLLGEHNQAILSRKESRLWHWWYTGYFFANLFDTRFPINPSRRFKTHSATITMPNAYTEAASSAHRGGAMFAFADGSVRFLKDSIDTWAFDGETGNPFGVVGDYGTPYFLRPGTRLGVYQSLSTRNGRELVDANDL